MSNDNKIYRQTGEQQKIDLYATPPHPCSYFSDGRQAITLYLDPYYPKSQRLYDFLTDKGFRRSGGFLYRHDCQHCQQCTSIRVNVAAFKPRRTQRRVLKKNQDLTITVVESGYQQEHFDLYKKYVNARHQNSGMDNPNKAEYTNFLCGQWEESFFYEFRLDQQLLAVAVVDPLAQGLSAIYTFYHPEYDHRSLGVFAILWQIQEAQRLDLPWVYLGFWIKDCRKMNYKTAYQPLEYYYKKCWHHVPPVTDSL